MNKRDLEGTFAMPLHISCVINMDYIGQNDGKTEWKRTLLAHLLS